MDGLRDVLNSEEIALLARYLYDQESQREIANEYAWSLATACRRIDAAIQKLAAAGITVRRPTVGRRPAGKIGKTRTIDPSDMTRLVDTGGESGGRPTFRWIDALKLDRQK